MFANSHPAKKNRAAMINSRRAQSNDEKMLQLTQALVDAERSQATSTVPLVRDMEPIVLRRNRVHSIQRTFHFGTITGSTTIDQTGAVLVTLGAFPTATDITNLFDQYRIVQVKVEFIPTARNEDSAALTTVIDYDDSATLTSLNQALQYDTRMSTTSGTQVTRVFAARPALAAYTGSFNGFTSSSPFTWIDSASTNISYYGCKYYLPAIAGAPTLPLYDIYVTGTIQGRSVY